MKEIETGCKTLKPIETGRKRIIKMDSFQQPFEMEGREGTRTSSSFFKLCVISSIWHWDVQPWRVLHTRLLNGSRLQSEFFSGRRCTLSVACPR